MIHRVGALLVGLIIILSCLNLKEDKVNYDNSKVYYRMMLFTAALWFTNLSIGATYLITATAGKFPEWISLLHLLGGVSTFLVAASGPMMFRLTQNSVAGTDG